MRNFGDSRRLSGMMTKLGMKDDEELQHPWLNKSVESAQRRVEERNYVSRKYTLQYDDVMNQQRTVIYAWRNDILTTETPREEIFEVVQEVIEGETEGAADRPRGRVPPNSSRGSTARSRSAWRRRISISRAGPEAVKKAALQNVRDAYDIKIKFEDPNALQSLERYTLLGAIDRLWQEHLYAIDSLRHSINLRTIGQKDPLIEYKREAFTMFSDLMGRIKLEIASSLFRTSASITAFESFLRNLPQKLIHETPPSPTMSTPDPAQPAAHAAREHGAGTMPTASPPRPRPNDNLPIRHDGPVWPATRCVRKARARSSSIAAAPRATRKSVPEPALQK